MTPLPHAPPTSSPTSATSLLRLASQTENQALNTRATAPADAFQTLLRAIDLYIQARKSSKDPGIIDKKLNRLLDLAEQWKAANPEPGLATIENENRKEKKQKKQIVCTGGESTAEQTVLLKSSWVGEGVFPPWKGLPEASEFALGEDGELYSDPAGVLPLSEVQESMLKAWTRAPELFNCGPDDGLRKKTGNDKRWDLTQDLVTDCSVVASLCAALRREEENAASASSDVDCEVSSIVYPQDASGTPIRSANGKYIVRLFFNGCWRKAMIDDLLPQSTSPTRALHVLCRNHPTVFIYALIEKAYLKIMGGYDFPGSNSGIDLLALTGWIPEHVFLQEEGLDADVLWNRMMRAWKSRELLVTLGTGQISPVEERAMGLVGEHDYAVLDMGEDEVGERWLMVKNPWSKGTVWKGLADDDDDDKDDVRDFDSPPTPSEQDPLDMKQLGDALPEETPPIEPGVFRITLNSVLRHFSSLYLNFSPTLFTHSHTTHFSYAPHISTSTIFLRNPQYTLSHRSPHPTPIWCLLTRHTTSPPISGFIALYLFPTSHTVLTSARPTLRTHYIDAPSTLLRIPSLPPSTPTTLIVSTQQLPPIPHSFTLQFFSLAPLTITAPTPRYPYTLPLTSSWHPTSSGGPITAATYPANPQLRLTLPRATSLGLVLETAADERVHIALFRATGARLHQKPCGRDVVANSGEYVPRSTLLETELEPGAYTAVFSTWRGGEGRFDVSVLSGDPGVGAEWWRGEGEGCFRVPRGGMWEEGLRRVAVGLEVERLGKCWVGIKGGRGWVEEVDGGRVVLKSLEGRTECGDLWAGVGGYRVVIERVGRAEEEWEMEVVSEVGVWVGEGEDLE